MSKKEKDKEWILAVPKQKERIFDFIRCAECNEPVTTCKFPLNELEMTHVKRCSDCYQKTLPPVQAAWEKLQNIPFHTEENRVEFLAQLMEVLRAIIEEMDKSRDE